MATASVSPSDSAQSKRIVVVTSDRTLKRHEAPALITNEGATSAVKVTLPQDAKGGEEFEFLVLTAQNLQVDPGAAGAIYQFNGTNYAKRTDDKYVQGAAVGDFLRINANGDGDWLGERGSQSGFQTVEA